jgi:hypothetical protein
MIRIAKKAEPPLKEKNLAYRMFVEAFMTEIRCRETTGQVFETEKGSTDKYRKMFIRVAHGIWEQADKLHVNPNNLAFVFLNRYYPIFIGKGVALPRMPFFWDDFLIHLSHEGHVINLLNYTEEEKNKVFEFIKEIQEAKKSKAFEEFVRVSAQGFIVYLPEHRYERSKLFETLLLMFQQMTDHRLDYFLTHNAIEILKAHVWNFKKYGNPINIYLGSLIGDIAMGRLKSYYQTFIKGHRVEKSFGGSTESSAVELQF